MQVVFRVDASIQIGTGHVMRCLVLAEQLKKRKADIVFICCHLPGNLMQVLKNKGFQVKSLEYARNASDHLREIQDNWELDAQAVIEEIKQDTPIDYIVVDHYALDYHWERAISPFVHKLLVIDDLENRRHDCDCLIDQNLYPDKNRYQDLINEKTDLLLGPKYLLLREEFSQTHLPSLRHRPVQRILVSFGGSDPTNETLKTVKALVHIPNPCEADIVIGSVNPFIDTIQNYAEQYPFINLYTETTHLAEMMAEADLAIGAGGTTTWERCYMQLPTITIETADNQHAILTYLHHLGMIHHLGKSKDVSANVIKEAITTFQKHPLKLKQMSAVLTSYNSMVEHGAIVRYMMEED